MGTLSRSDPALSQWFSEGVEHLKGERWGEAESVYRRILSVWPEVHEVHVNLGMALKSQRKLGEAEAAYRRALELRPDVAETWNDLGDTLRELNRLEDAAKAYHEAIARRADYPEPYNGLGILLRNAHQPARAIESFRKALSIRGDFALGWSNLAATLKDVGRLDESLACSDRALGLQPGHPGAHSARIYLRSFQEAEQPSAIYRDARSWNERFALPLAGHIPPHDNDRSLHRRLRVGYVGADFRTHCLSLFTGPLLANHDHEGFEVFCYSSVGVPDGVTARLRRYADVWRDVAGVNDTKVCRLIHQDKIDILVDLNLHMAGSRLGVFARKPAPIQATWLGYPGTTGLDTIDYRISDPRLDPPSAGVVSPAGERPDHIGFKQEFYSEWTVCLPDSFWCYDAGGMEGEDHPALPETGPLPALASGRLTFGCLNNFCKVTDQSLALWARVMAALPNSRMIMLASPGPHRQRIAQRLGLWESDRLEFVPIQDRRQYLETYRCIDLCLDTLPYNGHTTSLDSMWMGVPVVTKVGKTVVGRAGLSQLHNLGLIELVTHTDEDFVRVAVAWGEDTGRLSALRATLRRRMAQSPLMDGPRFARNMEGAFRGMWTAWVSTR